MILVHSKQIHFLFYKYIYITIKEENALIKILLMSLNEES